MAWATTPSPLASEFQKPYPGQVEPPRAKLERLAQGQVDTIVAELPAPLRERARLLPVTFQARPNRLQKEDGIEPDTLGLFVGMEFGAEESTTFPLPAQIILFLENLWDQAEGDETAFVEEVRTTYLHELGHYLGLDEADLFDRGLE